MGLIKWNSFYSVHIDELDEQHKELIHLINEMYDAMKNGKGTDALGSILSELVEYTKYHFDAEEKLFLQYGYPEREAHAKFIMTWPGGRRHLRTSLTRGMGRVPWTSCFFSATG